MKKLLFFSLLILFSCNQRKYSILEAENLSLKHQKDSLTVALATTRDQARILSERRLIYSEQQRMIAEEQHQAAIAAHYVAEQQSLKAEEQHQAVIAAENLADQWRQEAEAIRQKYDSLLLKCQK